MIKKITLSLLAIIILASCSSKFGIQKRRYTKGFYVSATKNKSIKAKEESFVKVESKQNKPEQVLAESNSYKNNEDLPAEKNNIKSTDFKVVGMNLTKSKSKQALYTSAEKIVLNKKISASKIEQSIEHINNYKTSRGSGGSTNKIVLVILCIFIPFLGVFFFEDDITSNFWLDLILCILFWLPGIIYAFLVCFAGVSIN